MIFTKTKEGVRAIRAIKYKKYEAEKYTRARAPLARKYTNRILQSKDGTTSMKIVNWIERHNFCLNDLLTKSNRTEIQTYKAEERTFGTPRTTYNVPEGFGGAGNGDFAWVASSWSSGTSKFRKKCKLAGLRSAKTPVTRTLNWRGKTPIKA